MDFITAQASQVQTVVQAFRLDLAMKLVLAAFAGGAVGLERQIAGKPAGLRTNILICIGSALVMDLSMNLGTGFGGPRVGDPGRIAAQVITGIGFIGAGTIMQARGAITGLTSAATIWVVAGIGLTAGAGYYFEAMGATVLVMLVLAGLGPVEHRLLRARRTMHATVRTKPGVQLEWIKTELFSEGVSIMEVKTFDHSDDRVFEMKLSGPALQFDIARGALLDRAEVLNVVFS